MSFRIVQAAINAEQVDALHEARLLLLLRHAAERKDGSIDGITKLAKMDFLLRYPVYFERLLNANRRKPASVAMRPYEKDTVESKMIRFRYGPWDPRYRRWIGILVAKGLAHTYLKGKTVYIKLTESGEKIAKAIASDEEFRDLDERSHLISKAVGAKSGSWIKDQVYKVVPELSGLRWGKEIDV